jgi:hypothetical protein
MSAYGFDEASPGSGLPTPRPGSINQIIGHRGTQKMTFDQIPEALWEPPQWVCWELEIRGGKATKVLYSARTGRKAARTMPQHGRRPAKPAMPPAARRKKRRDE